MQNPADNNQATLILASASRYRKSQLLQLVNNFECIPAEIDETALPGEVAADMVERLALAKAHEIAANRHDAIVLGSDQAAVLGDRILGKPGNVENARRQLAQCSGNSVSFETAVALVQHSTGLEKLTRVTTLVEFRTLSAEEISRYVARDNPVDCAGSFKIESAGSSLFEKVVSEDPTALVGLPLIATARMLRQAGIPLP